MPATRESALADLRHPRAPKRMSAARALQRLGEPGDALALRDAVERELEGRQSWEVLFRLCLALALLDDGSALDKLRSLAAAEREATAVNMAAAFAMTYIAHRTEGRAGADVLSELVQAPGVDEALAGALAALAELETQVPEELQSVLVNRAMAAFEAGGTTEPLVTSLLQAAYLGCGPELRGYTEFFLQPQHHPAIRELAQAALRGEPPGRTMNW